MKYLFASPVLKMMTKLMLLACLVVVANARSIENLNYNLRTFTSRIIGGQDAKQGEFPHQVSLQLKWPQASVFELTHFCGGSILNEQWILTAAHCLVLLEAAATIGDKGAIFVVKAGKHDLSSTEDTEQTTLIDQFFIHEEFDRRSELGVGPYDIGLIKLKKPLRLNKRVVKIGLPAQGSEPTGKVILSGWGAINANGSDPDMPYVLQTATLDIIDRVTCNQAVKKLHEQIGQPLSYDLVDETNICSGPIAGGISACGGDSGGPLISKDNNGKTEVIGIVSWGTDPCGTKGAPTVYTRTAFFVDWIEEVMKAHS